MTTSDVIYQNIFENMSDGVMTLESEGRISMFNQAAADILGVNREDVLDKGFAEVFLLNIEGNDDFNQVVLDAVYQSVVGKMSMVDFCRPDGETIHLSITSSYLKQSTNDTGEAIQGVIIVFNDITEVQNLRKHEKELNLELIQACRKAEESNKNLNTALRRVQVIRIVATIFVITLFVGLGGYIWKQRPGDFGLPSLGSESSSNRAIPSPGAAPMEGKGLGLAGSTATTSPLSYTLSLTGILAPLKKINLTTPFDAFLKKKYFEYGTEVQKGDILALLETAQFEVKVRTAETEYIKALQEYNGIKFWTSGREMSRAKRSLLKAKRSMESSQNKLKESQFLFDKGIISANDLKTAKDSYNNSQLEYKAAQEELESVLEKGSPENLKVAHIALINARTKKEELEEKLKLKEIRAPVDGLVIKATDSSSSNKKKILEIGSPVKDGDILFAVANLKGMSVSSKVDEIDIGKIKIGQKVLVQGDAFANISLAGEVSSISYQASSGNRGVPTFDVLIAINRIPEIHKNIIRLGMTATMEVKVYDNPAALLVPIDAVKTRDGQFTIAIKNPETGELKHVPVETGITTQTSVEILKGLSPGDEFVVEQKAAGGFNSM